MKREKWRAKKCKRRENSTTEEGFHISFSNFQLNERESGKIMVKRKFRNGDAKIARNERVQRTLCCEWNVRQAAAAAAFLFPWVHLGFSSLSPFPVRSHYTYSYNAATFFCKPSSLFFELYVLILAPFMLSNIISDCNFRCLCFSPHIGDPQHEMLTIVNIWQLMADSLPFTPESRRNRQRRRNTLNIATPAWNHIIYCS